MKRPFVSLHRLVTVLMVMLVVAALAVVGHIATDAAMRRTIDASRSDAQAISASDELQLSLLTFSRLSNLARLSALDGSLRPSIEAAHRHALDQLAGLKAFVDGVDERGLYDRAVATTLGFFDTRAMLEKSQPNPDLVQEGSARSLETALDALSSFRAYNAAQVDEEEAEAARWLWLTQAAHLLVFVIVVATTVVLAIALRRGLDRPLAALERSMARYARGERTARVHPEGPAELVAIGRAFNRMADELESARQSRLEFVASVAHDLRNPLTALKLATRRRVEPAPVPSETKEARASRLVHRQVSRMERMVEDLLEAARIEAGELTLVLEEVDLREVVAASVDLHQGFDTTHALVFDPPEEPLVVRCDALRLEQVLNNLVSNALKYSPGGGEVRVELSASGDAATIAVIDHGVGIAPEEREHIFEPFARGHGADRVARGAGLGLWAARRIVVAHGGELDFDSTPGAGSTFRVTLPRRAPARPPGPPFPTERADAAGFAGAPVDGASS